MAVSKKEGPFFVSPCTKHHSTSGSISRLLIFGNSHTQIHIMGLRRDSYTHQTIISTLARVHPRSLAPALTVLLHKDESRSDSFYGPSLP